MVRSGASQSGAVENYEQDMIEGVLDLQRAQVQQIMTPRVELVAVGDGSAASRDARTPGRTPCATQQH